MNDNPWIKMYPGDWRNNQALQGCSLAARGLWFELLCIMRGCPREGVLTTNCKPMPVSRVAALVNSNEQEVTQLLAELESSGVVKRVNGCVASPRMMRWSQQVAQGRRDGPKAVQDSQNATPPGVSPRGDFRGGSNGSGSESSESVSESRRESAEREPDALLDLHPATMSQKPVEPKKPRAPSGPTQVLIDLWLRLFVQEVFDETGTPVAYGKLHAGDGPAVARLARERPHEVQDLQLVERRMLALLRSQEAFWLTNRNLRTLCSRWTDIASIPIADHNRRASRPQNAHEETLRNILATRPTPAQENAHGVSGTQRLDQPRDRQALGSLPALQSPARNGHAPAGAVREVHPGRRGPRHLDVAGLLRGIVPVDGPDQPEPAG